MNIKELNELVSKLDGHKLSNGKPIPYMGWYWRDIDEDYISLSKGEEGYVGITVSNKWGYPEKVLSLKRTPEELKKLLGLIEKAAQPLFELYEYMEQLGADL